MATSPIAFGLEASRRAHKPTCDRIARLFGRLGHAALRRIRVTAWSTLDLVTEFEPLDQAADKPAPAG